MGTDTPAGIFRETADPTDVIIAMTDLPEDIQEKPNEQAIRRRLRLLEWIGVICGCCLAALITGVLWFVIGILYLALLAVFISITLVANYFYFRTKALLTT